MHLAWLKHPVVGDEVYGAGRDNTVQDPQLKSEIRKLGRQFLHASQLGFRHPRTDQTMKFHCCHCAAELEQLLAVVRIEEVEAGE